MNFDGKSLLSINTSINYYTDLNTYLPCILLETINCYNIFFTTLSHFLETSVLFVDIFVTLKKLANVLYLMGVFGNYDII